LAKGRVLRFEIEGGNTADNAIIIIFMKFIDVIKSGYSWSTKLFARKAPYLFHPPPGVG